MKRRTEVVDVIFRADRRLENGQRWITAVFPGLVGTYDPSTFTIYQHVGQHGSASLPWYRDRTRPATREEYAPLLEELKGIYEQSMGPDNPPCQLRIMKRFTRKHREERRAQVR